MQGAHRKETLNRIVHVVAERKKLQPFTRAGPFADYTTRHQKNPALPHIHQAKASGNGPCGPDNVRTSESDVDDRT